MSTLKTNNIEHLDATSPSIVVNAAGGIQVGGALTATTGTFSGNVSVAGVLSYEDVTNIDSVGIITANAGIDISNTIVSNNDSTIRYDNDTFIIDVDSNNVRGSSAFKVNVDTVNALTIDDNRKIGIGTDNPDYSLTIGDGSSYVIQNLKAKNDEFCEFRFGDPEGIAQGKITYDHATDSLRFTTNGDGEKVRIDSGGRLLIGAEVARSNFYNTTVIKPHFQIESAGSNDGNRMMSIVSNMDSAGYVPTIILGKSRGTVDNSHTGVANEDGLGKISFQGADGSELVEAATINSNVDATTGTNKIPGRLSFSTTDQTGAGPLERARIDSLGRLLVGNITNETNINARIWASGYDNLIISEGNSTGYTEGSFKGVSPNNSRGGGFFMFNYGGGGTTSQWFAGRPYGTPDQYIIARTTGNTVGDQSTAQTSNQLFSVYSSGNATLQGTLSQSGSDNKLKKDRTPLTSALEKVKTLEGFTFKWNDDAINNYGFPSDEGTLVGMSAQDLQSVLPEAVKNISKNATVTDPISGETGETQEYLTIQYDRVVPLLVEAIKELSAENTSLAARIAALES